MTSRQQSKEKGHKAPPPPSGVEVHMFWAYGDLSLLERISVASFVRHGYKVNLWSYDPIGGLPPGVDLLDAKKIITEDKVFRCQRGSYAAFSDRFRYSLLHQIGGLWADTDVICLHPATDFAFHHHRGFLVQEMLDSTRIQINNNIIYHPDPKPGDIIDLACAVSNRFSTSQIRWGDCGPKLLTTLVNSYPHLSPPIQEPHFANPICWSDCPEQLITEGVKLPLKSRFLHCFNEMWRRAGQDKNTSFPADSIMGRLQADYQDYL